MQECTELRQPYFCGKIIVIPQIQMKNSDQDHSEHRHKALRPRRCTAHPEFMLSIGDGILCSLAHIFVEILPNLSGVRGAVEFCRNSSPRNFLNKPWTPNIMRTNSIVTAILNPNPKAWRGAAVITVVYLVTRFDARCTFELCPNLWQTLQFEKGKIRSASAQGKLLKIAPISWITAVAETGAHSSACRCGEIQNWPCTNRNPNFWRGRNSQERKIGYRKIVEKIVPPNMASSLQRENWTVWRHCQQIREHRRSSNSGELGWNWRRAWGAIRWDTAKTPWLQNMRENGMLL